MTEGAGLKQWTLDDQRCADEHARERGVCDLCHKILSRNQTVVAQAFALCVDCSMSSMEEDDRVEVSVDMLRRLRDQILY